VHVLVGWVATRVVTASQSCNAVERTADMLRPVNGTRDSWCCSFLWLKDCGAAGPVASVGSDGLIPDGESTTRGRGCQNVERQDQRVASVETVQ
jgi:hypothetical protein